MFDKELPHYVYTISDYIIDSFYFDCQIKVTKKILFKKGLVYPVDFYVNAQYKSGTGLFIHDDEHGIVYEIPTESMDHYRNFMKCFVLLNEDDWDDIFYARLKNIKEEIEEGLNTYNELGKMVGMTALSLQETCPVKD